LWLAECVIALLIVSVAFADANPPDPSSIFGIYADDDDDDASRMVTKSMGISNSRGQHCADHMVVGFVLGAAAPTRVANPTVSGRTIRGPPVVACDVAVNSLLTSPPGLRPVDRPSH
jgi:hypothetical protein